MHFTIRPSSISRKGLLYRPSLFPQIASSIRLSSALAAAEQTPSRQHAVIAEFEEEIEKELAKLPVKRAEDARRQLRNERRAERNGVRIWLASPHPRILDP